MNQFTDFETVLHAGEGEKTPLSVLADIALWKFIQSCMLVDISTVLRNQQPITKPPELG